MLLADSWRNSEKLKLCTMAVKVKREVRRNSAPRRKWKRREKSLAIDPQDFHFPVLHNTSEFCERLGIALFKEIFYCFLTKFKFCECWTSRMKSNVSNSQSSFFICSMTISTLWTRFGFPRKLIDVYGVHVILVRLKKSLGILKNGQETALLA